MATPVHPDQTIVPARGDAIRIVPLCVPDAVSQLTVDAAAVASTVPPHLSYRNGPLLSAVEVFTIFWGPAWQNASQSGMATQLNQFFDFILASPLIDQLAEYDVPAYAITHGRRIGSLTTSTPTLRHSVSDAAIQHMLQQEISTNPSVPHPTPNTLYFVYIQPGVKVVQGGRVFYAAMPYPGCGGCTGGLTPFDALTSTSSHELCEAITDAAPGNGWYDDANGEIGDMCAWKTKKVGQYTVQWEWSNAANRCV